MANKMSYMFSWTRINALGLYSVQFNCSVVSVCLRPHGLQHARFLYHQLLEVAQTHVHQVGDAIQPSHPLLVLPSILPRIRVFSNEPTLHIRWPKYWSFHFSSVLPMNIQGWFPLGWTGLISLLSKGLSRVFANTTVQRYQFFGSQPFLIVQLSHPYTTTRKNIALTIWVFVGKDT